jgi:molecular chaperone GrpE
MSKVTKQNEEVEALKSQLARALADYDNLVKRTERTQTDLQKIISARLVGRLLPIVDMLESAMKHSSDPGLAIVLQQFKDTLKSEGFEEISFKLEDDFDALAAEVIDTVEGEAEKSGKIAEVLQSGWKYLDGTVVRHAKVKVYKAIENVELRMEN